MNTTQEVALSFVQRSLSTINKQLAVEIKRNGFSLESVRSNKQKLIRTVVISKDNPAFIAESFALSGRGKPSRVVMCVKWSPTGFTIEVNDDSTVERLKKAKKKNISKIVTGSFSQEDIEIEAAAYKIECESSDKLKRDSGIKTK